MKKILSVFAMTAVFAACNNNPKTNTDTLPAVTSADTATLNHNAFTDKAQEIQLHGISDTIVGSDGNAYVKVKPKEAEIAPVPVEKPMVRHTTVTHTKRVSTPASEVSPAKSAGTSKPETTSKSETSTVSNGTPAGSGTETTTTTTTETKKKGWSKAAKGAVIGAGTGAAAGAIFSKKKGTGAIIGGVIGGAGGYIFGRSKDKKDGRYLVDSTASKN